MQRMLASLFVVAALPLAAQQGGGRVTLSQNTRRFVSVDAPTVALTHVRLIDGTGAPPADDQTIVIKDGKIAAVGPARSTTVSAGSQVMELTGHTINLGTGS